MSGKDKITISKSKLLLMVIVVLVIIIGGLAFLLLQSPVVSSEKDAQKLGQEVTKNIADIKSALTEIKTGLKQS